MQNVGDQTNITMVNPRVHAVNLGGLSFRTEVAINNPSKDTVKITKPVVSLSLIWIFSAFLFLDNHA
jgi:hypothetical protein